MLYGRIVRQGLVTLTIIFLAGSAVAESEDSQQSIPPVKTQAVNTSNGKHHSQNPKPTPPSVPTPVIVSGDLGIHLTDTEKRTDTESDKWIEPVNIFNLLLVCVGGAQAWFIWLTFKAGKLNARATVRAARTARHTLRTMDDTAERQLRAYVLFESARTINVEVGKIPYVKITIKNFGQTPARIVAHRANVGFGHYPPTIGDPPPVDNSEFFIFILAPGAEYYAEPKFNQPLRQIEIDGINSGRAALYAFGEISYEDAFGKIRTTKYKLFSGGPLGLTDSMAPWKDGNEYN